MPGKIATEFPRRSPGSGINSVVRERHGGGDIPPEEIRVLVEVHAHSPLGRPGFEETTILQVFHLDRRFPWSPDPTRRQVQVNHGM